MWRSFFGRFRKGECDQTKEMLSTYIDQRLSLQEQQEVEQHLKACQKCQEELDSLRATVGLLRRVPQVSPSRSFAIAEAKPAPRRTAVWALRAATSVAAVVLVLAFASDMMNFFEATPSLVDERGEKAAQPGPGEDAGEIDLSEYDVSYMVVLGTENASAGAQTPAYDHIWGVVVGDEKSTLGVISGSEEIDLSEVDISSILEVIEVSEEIDLSELDISSIALAGTINTSALYSNEDGEKKDILIVLSATKKETTPDGGQTAEGEERGTEEAGWVRPLEYSLLGVVVVLGGATIAIWRRERQKRVAERFIDEK